MTLERVVPAPAEDVFAWLADASNYPRSRVVFWLRLRRPGEDAPYGTGAVRVLVWVMGWFRERITAYQPPHYFDYLVERSFPPSRHEGGRVSCTPSPAGTTVVWTTTARLAVPFIGDLVTRVVAKRVILWAFGRVLDTATRELTHV
jgi:uncharacterized protein YndB with AHSA1/START domain